MELAKCGHFRGVVTSGGGQIRGVLKLIGKCLFGINKMWSPNGGVVK